MSNALSIVKKFFPRVTEVVDANRAARVEVTLADADSLYPLQDKELLRY